MAPRTVPKQFHPADHGLVHAYLGDGKGKTTAAIGVAVRAAGHDWRVCFLQFMKSSQWPSGERRSLRKLGVEVEVLGEGFYKILGDRKPAEMHQAAAAKALAMAREKIWSGQYRLVIMDELGTAVEEKVLDKKAVEKLLRDHAKDKQAKEVNLIWTGHQKFGWMIKYADLVTEMKMIRHPYYQGIIATRGLDY